MDNKNFSDKDAAVVPSSDTETAAIDDKKPKEKSGEMLKIWKEFGDSTTMHGLGRAVHSQRLWKRLVWCILVLVAACIASRNLYITFVDYFSYPVSTTISLNARNKLGFPAVTVCNLNPYRISYLKEEVQEKIKESVQRNDSAEVQKENFLAQLIQHYDVYNLPANISSSMEAMLIDCKFDLISCGVDDFAVIHDIKNGDCFTITSNWNTSRAGNENGLIMEFDIGQDEYLPFTPAAGLKVLIHSPSVMPFPYEDGVVVRPGVATNIGIKKVKVERQIPPWGSCLREEDVSGNDKMNMYESWYMTKYSETACGKTCYQLTVIADCECCDINYPCISTADSTFRDCNESAPLIQQCLQQIRYFYLTGLLRCMKACRPPCQETMYRTSYSIASWPSVNYLDNLSRKAAKVRARRNNKAAISTEDLNKNFVRLEVHYETLMEESIVATPAYNWNTLLSDLGGQLGLWMGFSIMTAIEFLELGWDFLVNLICRPSKDRRVEVAKC